MNLLWEIIVIIGSYLIGCFSTGYYVLRLSRNIDIREQGSGNIGARNAGRLLGPWGFGLTFAGDIAKGALVVLIARFLDLSAAGTVTAMIAVLAGHIWPVQLQFRGGKGIATYLGVLFVYNYASWFLLCGLVLTAYLPLRNVILSGMAAITILPVLLLFMHQPVSGIAGFTTAAGLLLWAHRANIREEINRLTDLHTIEKP